MNYESTQDKVKSKKKRANIVKMCYESPKQC